jgi:hypothetical protein
MLWIWPVVIVAMVVVVMYLVTSELASSTGARVEATLACPVNGKVASVALQSDFFEPSRYRTVHRCSLCANGEPTCAMACLDLPKDMIVPTRPSLAVLHA